MKGIDQFRDHSLHFARQLCEIRNTQEAEDQRQQSKGPTVIVPRSPRKAG